MENTKNVSKTSLAAVKAWATRRTHQQQNEKQGKEEKKQKQTKVKTGNGKVGQAIEAKAKREATAEDKEELGELNGAGLDRMEREQGKQMRRKAKIEKALGRPESKAISVGRILEKAKVERFNGGVKLVQ